MTTNVDITKRALAQIGTRTTITSMTDGSQEALYANLLYNPLRDFLLREGDYDFSFKKTSASAAASVGSPWNFAYVYPTGALKIRQVIPLTYNTLDPKPVAWNVFIQGDSTKLVVSKEAINLILYTTAPLNEDLWDPLFTESFTRLLASALAFALENRIEASKEKLAEAISFAGIANLRIG